MPGLFDDMSANGDNPLALLGDDDGDDAASYFGRMGEDMGARETVEGEGEGMGAEADAGADTGAMDGGIFWEEMTDFDMAATDRTETFFGPQLSPSFARVVDLDVGYGQDVFEGLGNDHGPNGEEQQASQDNADDSLIAGDDREGSNNDNDQPLPIVSSDPSIEQLSQERAASLPRETALSELSTRPKENADGDADKFADVGDEATEKVTESAAENTTENTTENIPEPPSQHAPDHDADEPMPTTETDMAMELDDQLQQETLELQTEQNCGPSDSAAASSRPEIDFEILLDPLPVDRRAEYEPVGPSNYVYRVVQRNRGGDKARVEVEYDDGRCEVLATNVVTRLPNGRRALFDLVQTEAEGEDELSWNRGAKRRRIAREDDFQSSGSDMDMDTTFNAPSTKASSEIPNQDDMTGMDSDRYTRPRRRRRRLLTSNWNEPVRQSSRQLCPRGAPKPRRDFYHSPPPDAGKDELASDDDELFISTVTSDIIQPPRRRRGGGGGRRSSAMRTIHDDQDDDPIQFVEHRRSSRANKNTQNMAEAYANIDDNMYADGDRVPVVPKTVNIHEVFQPVEKDPFLKAHMPLCHSCNRPARVPNKGVMIHCQGCSLSFHKGCIGIRNTRDHLATKVGPDSFVLQCRYCVGWAKVKDPSAPALDQCQVCHEKGASCAAFSTKKTAKQEEKLREENDGVDPITPVAPELVDNAENVLFRCTGCLLAFHFEHLPPPSSSWVSGDNEDVDDVREARRAEYSIEWRCRTCLEMPAKVDALVAWRPTAGPASYKPGQDLTEFDEEAKEYLVKWHEKSYAHCEWKPGAWVWGVTHARMRLAFAKTDTPPVFETKDAFPEEYLYADIVFSVRYKHGNHAAAKSKQADLARIDDVAEVMVKYQGLGYDHVVWDEPPPRESGKRWRSYALAYDEFLDGKHFKSEPYAAIRQRMTDFQARKKFEIVKKQPGFLRRGELMSYQMDGLNWLLLNFYKGKSVVLADEMGLGKTVQVVALLAMLVLQTPRCWPFLVVVPNSTCPNWRREIKTWALDLRVVTYHGGRQSQQYARDYELFPDGSDGANMRAHVVIMSYDSAQDEATRRYFGRVHWAGLVVDEGQRLKNDQNLLYLALRAMRIGFRLLLTGTPLQNNKRELFNLLQFIDSTHNAAELDETYREVTVENLPQLHKLIRPYFLRRTKAEVLKFLPPMAQIIVPVTMTVVQEKLYKSILAKNSHLIQAIFTKGRVRASERGSLNNILMQLRKCLCHPFVYSDAIEDKTVDAETMQRNLIEASSKLMLLKIMLPKLKARGHRVLLFSQFLHQLSIVEDFLQLLGLPYERLDGNLSSLEKQRRIDAFNAPDSELFAFLLSTRAGGVGINLATADTVIVLDPDFNPHQDIQAFSRAHRIGQKKKVLCFQLMTKDSVEEKIMQIGRKKMALDHALIESMDTEDDMSNDLESILQHGTEALFSGQGERIVYDSASVDRLLDRSQVEDTKTDEARTAESQFSFARVWANETGSLKEDIEITDAADDSSTHNTWEVIIREREAEAEAAAAAAAEHEQLGRGRRRRATRKNGYLLPSDGLLDAERDEHDGEFTAKQEGDEVYDSSASSYAEDEEVLEELRGVKDAPNGGGSNAGGIAGSEQQRQQQEKAAGRDKSRDSSTGEPKPRGKKVKPNPGGDTDAAGSGVPVVGFELRGGGRGREGGGGQDQAQEQLRQQQQQHQLSEQLLHNQQQQQQHLLQEQQRQAREKQEQYRRQRQARQEQLRQEEQRRQEQLRQEEHRQWEQQQQREQQYIQQLQQQREQQYIQQLQQQQQQQQHHQQLAQHHQQHQPPQPAPIALDEQQQRGWDFLLRGQNAARQRIAELLAQRRDYETATQRGDAVPFGNSIGALLDRQIHEAQEQLQTYYAAQREFYRRLTGGNGQPPGSGAPSTGPNPVPSEWPGGDDGRGGVAGHGQPVVALGQPASAAFAGQSVQPVQPLQQPARRPGRPPKPRPSPAHTPQPQQPPQPPETGNSSGTPTTTTPTPTTTTPRKMDLVIALEVRRPSPRQEPTKKETASLASPAHTRCRRCKTVHAAGAACPNLQSEAGIRLALDSLLTDDAAVEGTRKELVARLRELVRKRRGGMTGGGG